MLNADFTPIPCNRLVTGLHKVPVVSDNRLPSLEDIDESHKQSPNTKKLSHASSKKQVLTVPKNEENESSDEDLEGVQPKSTTSLNKLSEQKYTGSSRDNLADIQEEEEPIHSPKIEKNHSKENIENQQKSFSKIKISQVVSEEKKMPPGENS